MSDFTACFARKAGIHWYTHTLSLHNVLLPRMHQFHSNC